MNITTGTSVTVNLVIPKGTEAVVKGNTISLTEGYFHLGVTYPDGSFVMKEDTEITFAITAQTETADGSVSASQTLDGGDGSYRFALYYGAPGSNYIKLGTTVVRKVTDAVTVNFF